MWCFFSVFQAYKGWPEEVCFQTPREIPTWLPNSLLPFTFSPFSQDQYTHRWTACFITFSDPLIQDSWMGCRYEKKPFILPFTQTSSLAFFIWAPPNIPVGAESEQIPGLHRSVHGSMGFPLVPCLIYFAQAARQFTSGIPSCVATSLLYWISSRSCTQKRNCREGFAFSFGYCSLPRTKLSPVFIF